MPDIKTKKKENVKTIDKTINKKKIKIKQLNKNLKKIDTINHKFTKKVSKENKEESKEKNYAIDKVENAINKTTIKGAILFNKKGYESAKNIIKDIKTRESLKNKYEIIDNLTNNNKTYVEKLNNNKVNDTKDNVSQNTNTNTIKDNPTNIDNENIEIKNKKIENINGEQMCLINKNVDNTIILDNNINKDTKINIKDTEDITTFKTSIRTKENILENKNYQIKTKENMHEIKGINRQDKIKISNNIELPNKANLNIYNTDKIKKSKVKQVIEETIQKTKKVSNNIKKIIKSIINGTEKIMEFLIAGGWIVLVIIIVISLISFITTSIFGIFISDKITTNSVTIKSVMNELNSEFTKELTTIQNQIPHDEFDIKGKRATWKDIIAVFIAKYSNGNYRTELITLDDDKVNSFKSVFFEMDEITYFTEEVSKEIEITDDKGNTQKVTIKSTVLHIVINGKSIKDVGLSDKQLSMVQDILKDEYTILWEQLLYGSSNGSTDIVEVAKSQLGQVGGYPYWSWYGFESRVSWCACFVSWCANECGYIDNGIIPKFAGCESEGVTWFQTCESWQDNSYIPNPGDIIFFDWESDGISDHVGIVEKVEDGLVYTIEGNSDNSCAERSYSIGDWKIKGYGLLNINN